MEAETRGMLNVRRRIAALAAGACLLGLALAGATQASAGFKPVGLKLPGEEVFDAGFMSHEGALGAFTINHKYRSVFRINGVDATGLIGMAPSRAFPGFEYLTSPAPRMTRPGLYLHATDRSKERGGVVHLRAYGQPVTGKLVFTAGLVQFRDRAGAILDPRTSDRRRTVTFEIEPGGFADIWVSNLDLPLGVLDAEQPTFVGARAVPSKTEDFDLYLRDRHSYAAGDFNDDGESDLFIATGGFNGGIGHYAGLVSDELLFNEEGRFAPGPTLDKGVCRGRGAAAPDINGDGHDDIFMSCEGQGPSYYLQGQWQLRKLPTRAENYIWTNLDRDRAVEMLAFKGRRMQVLEQGRRPDGRTKLRGVPTGRPVIGDLLNRGRPAIVVPSRKSSTIISGKRTLDPRKLGLPRRMRAAAIVDVDNDGLRDLHTAPGGLYRQVKPGRFRRSGKLRRAGDFVSVSWGDWDGDGRRDLLSLAGPRLFTPEQSIRGWRNRERSGHWLAVESPELQLGDEIVVKAKGRRYHGWVGESEGSHLSDTHRRVYFGLGKAKRATVYLRPAQGPTRAIPTPTNRLLRIPAP